MTKFINSPKAIIDRNATAGIPALEPIHEDPDRLAEAFLKIPSGLDDIGPNPTEYDENGNLIEPTAVFKDDSGTYWQGNNLGWLEIKAGIEWRIPANAIIYRGTESDARDYAVNCGNAIPKVEETLNEKYYHQSKTETNGSSMSDRDEAAVMLAKEILGLYDDEMMGVLEAVRKGNAEDCAKSLDKFFSVNSICWIKSVDLGAWEYGVLAHFLEALLRSGYSEKPDESTERIFYLKVTDQIIERMPNKMRNKMREGVKKFFPDLGRALEEPLFYTNDDQAGIELSQVAEALGMSEDELINEADTDYATIKLYGADEAYRVH